MEKKKAKRKRIKTNEGKSFATIAKELGISPMTAKNIHDRAIQKIKILLEEQKEDYESLLYQNDSDPSSF